MSHYLRAAIGILVFIAAPFGGTAATFAAWILKERAPPEGER